MIQDKLKTLKDFFPRETCERISQDLTEITYLILKSGKVYFKKIYLKPQKAITKQTEIKVNHYWKERK